MVRLVAAVAAGVLAWGCGSDESEAGAAAQRSDGGFGEACDSALWNLPDGGGPCALLLSQCADAGSPCEVIAACAPTTGQLDDAGNFGGPAACTVHCGETPEGPALCAALGGTCVTATDGSSPVWCRAAAQ